MRLPNDHFFRIFPRCDYAQLYKRNLQFGLTCQKQIEKSLIDAPNPIYRYGRKSKMILQRKFFEKLKASRKASFRLTRSKPVHFQQLHENTHEMSANVSNENRIRKQRPKQTRFGLLHENTHQINAKVTTENENRYGDPYEIIIRIVLR